MDKKQVAVVLLILTASLLSACVNLYGRYDLEDVTPFDGLYYIGNMRISLERMNHIYDFFSDHLPELDALSIFIHQQSNGYANLFFRLAGKQEIKHGAGYDYFYLIQVGESWPERGRQVTTMWFYVDRDLTEILFLYNASNEILTLESWRSSEYYPAFLKSNMPAQADQQSYRSFNSTFNFPFYEGIEFVGGDVFEFLKEIYSNINFFGEFKIGNTDIRDYYRRNFARLINNQVPFINRETGEVLYLADLLGSYMQHLSSFHYIFFDFDLDGSPELGINARGLPFFMFKYMSETDEFALLFSIEGTNRGLLGSQRTYFSRLGEDNEFTKFNERGECEYFIRFFIQGVSRITTGVAVQQFETIYMVSLPRYEHKQLEIPTYVRNQGYFSEHGQMYFFRVTSNQFDQLTSDFFESIEQSRLQVADMLYTFEDLFGYYSNRIFCCPCLPSAFAMRKPGFDKGKPQGKQRKVPVAPHTEKPKVLRCGVGV